MKKVRWVSATAGTALVAAMFALPGAGVAHASDNGNTTGNGNVSILSGNSITAPISVPVNLCGISLAVAGFSNSGCEGGSSSVISGVGGDSHNGNTTGNRNISLGSGNTITAPVSAPVNVCGGGERQEEHSGRAQVTAPVSVPVNLCGNAVAAAGYANANCKGGSTSCIGSHCNHPNCQGQCHDCQGPACHDCHGPACHDCHGPACHPCQGPACHDCHGPQCNPCHGDNCHCHGNDCNPPGCTANSCGRHPAGLHGQLRRHPAGLHGQLRRHPAGLHGQLRRHPAGRHHARHRPRHRPRHHHHGEHRDLA